MKKLFERIPFSLNAIPLTILGAFIFTEKRTYWIMWVIFYALLELLLGGTAEKTVIRYHKEIPNRRQISLPFISDLCGVCLFYK
ncbi:MAG: hypothetical protein LBN93_11390 [Candidatus Symbiothrix sp.]|jgi:hypothetical protein|nr:hypothetical protein [Candidatus Symbiothrix sp.]